MRIKIDVTGIDEIKRKLGSDAADDLKNAIDIDIGVETRNMANQGANNAPVETGALQASVRYSTTREGEMTYSFGSYLPYALRQEYEHKTKKAYLRRAYWEGQPKTAATLRLTIKKRLGG